MALGIVLILVGAAMFAMFILGGAQGHVEFNFLGVQAGGNALAVFIAGVVAAALVLIGVRLVQIGIRRDVRRMRKTRELKQQAETATRAAEQATREAEQAKEKATKHEHLLHKKDGPGDAKEPEKPQQPEAPTQP